MFGNKSIPSPTKRSKVDMKAYSPRKLSSIKKKQTNVMIARTGDGTSAVVWGEYPGQPPTKEPFTWLFHKAILDKEPKVLSQGFILKVSRTLNPMVDVPIRTEKGYDYKAFIVSEDEVMDETQLREKAEFFCYVSIF
jgi:hypothetical protein